jgi:hypothetical protein
MHEFRLVTTFSHCKIHGLLLGKKLYASLLGILILCLGCQINTSDKSDNANNQPSRNITDIKSPDQEINPEVEATGSLKSENELSAIAPEETFSKGDLYIFCQTNGKAIKTVHNKQFGLVGQIVATQRSHGEGSQQLASLLEEHAKASGELESLIPANARQGKSAEQAAMLFADCNNFRD